MLLGLGISAPEAFRNGESQAGLLDGCRTLQHYLMCVTDTGAEFGLLLLQLTSRKCFMSTLPPRWTEQCNCARQERTQTSAPGLLGLHSSLAVFHPVYASISSSVKFPNLLTAPLWMVRAC